MGNFTELRSSNRLSYIWLMVTIFCGVASLYLIIERSGHTPDSSLFAINQLLIGLTFGAGIVTAITRFTQKNK
ncbi:MAG: hypothetical protein O2809_00780 [Proteobacteria bacterium]|nr:hypothetical protein [Pseudomonadota bacterium]